jgi:hypothetical protein
MNGTISSYCAERGRNTAVLAAASIHATSAFTDDSSSPQTTKLHPRLTFEPTKGLARMDEAEFEAQLHEFCRFARLGFTILNQSPSQLVGVGNVLRSLDGDSAAGDLLKLVTSGGEKAEALLELTNAAKLRCEAAFLMSANGSNAAAARS